MKKQNDFIRKFNLGCLMDSKDNILFELNSENQLRIKVDQSNIRTIVVLDKDSQDELRHNLSSMLGWSIATNANTSETTFTQEKELKMRCSFDKRDSIEFRTCGYDTVEVKCEEGVNSTLINLNMDQCKSVSKFFSVFDDGVNNDTFDVGAKQDVQDSGYRMFATHLSNIDLINEKFEDGFVFDSCQSNGLGQTVVFLSKNG